MPWGRTPSKLRTAPLLVRILKLPQTTLMSMPSRAYTGLKILEPTIGRLPFQFMTDQVKKDSKYGDKK
jgi:hypothetical protein